MLISVVTHYSMHLFPFLSWTARLTPMTHLGSTEMETSAVDSLMLLSQLIVG